MKKRTVSVISLLCLLVIVFTALTSCGAPEEYQGKYNNTKKVTGYDESYINVTDENTAYLMGVYIPELGYFNGGPVQFDVSSDAEYIYVEVSSYLSIRADFNASKKTIEYAGFTYKKS